MTKMDEDSFTITTVNNCIISFYIYTKNLQILRLKSIDWINALGNE